MPRYALTIEYDGAPYCGWQRQPDQATVQGTLEAAAARLNGAPVDFFGSGRTDSGVHALGQIAHMDLLKDIRADKVRDAMNYHLGDAPITVLDAHLADPEFHARFDATSREYLYRIIDRRPKLALERGRLWRIPMTMDVDAMHHAAQTLIGTHDFTTFSCVADRDDAGNTRTLYQCRVEELDGLLVVKVVGDGFLYRMVRRIVGFLVGVGSGRISPEDTGRLLAARDRNGGFSTAPPQGLFLYDVFFDEDQRDSWELEVMPLLFPPRP